MGLVAMDDIEDIKAGLGAWYELTERSPDAVARFQAMRLLLCDEMERAGFIYQEVPGTFSFPGGTDGLWRGIRCQVEGHGKVFEAYQEGRDEAAKFHAVCKVYLKAVQWLRVKGMTAGAAG